ncbi:hypothetical protein DM02DRAFT_208054 [Periconia macrospinosa]|uniref:3-carboxymuconate cyclase n=1 Tax=Periconia macrospinosa TaxID=97972 RepID=A0A2V1E3F9_9PLEO|nr:hypothetical protein DM02DRAFT_208054 [Periconia macrospinosa]
MHFPTHTILALTALAPLTEAHPRPPQDAKTGKAVYAITNSDNNSVLAMTIQADGKLGAGKLTATMGKGAVSMNAMGMSAPTDALVSQSALTLAGKHIFAVNAGSNTVSMLAISPDDPTQLRMVGNPAAVPGTFPNTVAASVKNSMVCVGTSGSRAGVSCGTFDQRNGIGEMRQISSFKLNQSDPPVGPTNTVSHTFFSADEMMLFTTVKGTGMANNTGFLSTVPVSMAANGDCEPMVGKEVRSSPNSTAVLFGSQAIPGANPPKIFATDASFGAAVLSVDSTGKAMTVGKGEIKGQMATCWAAISPATGTAFVSDVGVNHLVEMSLKDASIVDTIDLSKGASAMNPGMIDLRAAGNFLYALSPGNGTSQAAISVLDVKSKKLVQNADLGSLGVRNTAMGMAVLM